MIVFAYDNTWFNFNSVTFWYEVPCNELIYATAAPSSPEASLNTFGNVDVLLFLNFILPSLDTESLWSSPIHNELSLIYISRIFLSALPISTESFVSGNMLLFIVISEFDTFNTSLVSYIWSGAKGLFVPIPMLPSWVIVRDCVPVVSVTCIILILEVVLCVIFSDGTSAPVLTISRFSVW